VGIGTTSPFAKLDVEGRVNIGTGTSQNTFIASSTQLQLFTDGGTANSLGIWQAGIASGEFGVKASDSNLYITNTYSQALGTASHSITLTNAGNVGIGTTSPAYKLDVSDTSGSLARFKSTTASDQFYINNAASNPDYSANVVIQSDNAGSAGHDLFRAQVTNSSGTKFVIKSSGNVGIGTTNPGADLDVVKTTAGYVIGRWQNNDQGSSSFAMLTVNAYGNSWGMRMGTIAANSNRLDFVEDANGARTPRLSIAVGGNVGIGTTSPTDTLSLAKSGTGIYNSIRFTNPNSTADFYVGIGGSAVGNASLRNNAYIYNGAASALIFGTNDAERARIDTSGNLLVGTTSAAGNLKGIQANNTSSTQWPLYTTAVDRGLIVGMSATDGIAAYFMTSTSTAVGSITCTSSATSYNTSSDYRRKSNVKNLTGSGRFIDALKPRTFDWDTGDKGVGFIAHEFAEVSPSSVHGEKDAVDADGKPIYQAMQASSAEVIANLVAELQSVRQRLAALESK
jgi:hypothetical protein